MKNYITIILIFTTFLFSCNSDDNNKEEVIYESVTDTASATQAEDSSLTVINRPSLWTIEIPTNAKAEKLKMPSDEKIKTLSVDQLVTALNNNFSDVQLRYEKISHDTMFVSIPESEKLTQQLGSTGAYNYMATAVYNLTELNQIKYIHFAFKPGDHAVPGTFSRDDYKQLR
ncbi:MAG: hypothetical protein ABIP35_08545 [Ginsengibacter sp.]